MCSTHIGSNGKMVCLVHVFLQESYSVCGTSLGSKCYAVCVNGNILVT